MKVGLGTLLVALALLLLSDVTAPTVDPARTTCGSLPQTLKTQTGFHGGEMRPDQDEFNAACVQAANRRVRLMIAGGVVAAGIATYLVITRPKKSAQGALPANSNWL